MAYNPFGYPGYAQNIQSGTTDIQGVTWVSSIDEVKPATVPFGKQIFMDRNNDIFYVKDSMGSIKAFSFKEIPIPSNNPADFVTKNEFARLEEKIEQLIATTSAATATQQPQPNADYAADATVQWDAGASQTTVLQPDCVNGTNQVAVEQPA